MDCLLAASKAEDAHEYYRSDTRPNAPCGRVLGLAMLMSRVRKRTFLASPRSTAWFTEDFGAPRLTNAKSLLDHSVRKTMRDHR